MKEIYAFELNGNRVEFAKTGRSYEMSNSMGEAARIPVAEGLKRMAALRLQGWRQIF